jgi:hypothetical protein
MEYHKNFLVVASGHEFSPIIKECDSLMLNFVVVEAWTGRTYVIDEQIRKECRELRD